MLELLAAMFLQSIIASLLGGYGGYRYAIRGTAPAEHPSGPWQLMISVTAGFGGTLLTVLFTIALVMAFPNADTEKLTAAVPLVLGLGLGIAITHRHLQKQR